MTKTLSQILVDNFGVAEDDIEEVRRVRREKGGGTGEILVQKKMVSETQLLEALSIRFDIPFWPDISLDNFGTEFTRLVPIQFLKRYVLELL